MPQRITCTQANKKDLVDYLDALGFKPVKVRGNDYWFLSPLREETTASFKVNRKLNIWYDHGTGEGGTMVDFGKRYHNCSVSELLQKLSEGNIINLSFHPPKIKMAGEKKEQNSDSGKILIISESSINNPVLKDYLAQRKIPLEIATKYCREIGFEINGKKQLAIGLRNENGGYELRNPYFKGSSTPKQPLIIRHPESKELAVFEGFFSFLSYEAIKLKRKRSIVQLPKQQVDSLILNSLSFFEKFREMMEKYTVVHLCLDRDKMGQEFAEKALTWSDKFKDQSKFYEPYKDLNDYLIKSQSPELNQSCRRGMRL